MFLKRSNQVKQRSYPEKQCFSGIGPRVFIGKTSKNEILDSMSGSLVIANFLLTESTHVELSLAHGNHWILPI